MNLSDLIEKGSKGRLQITGGLFRYNFNQGDPDKVSGCCAMGAAMLGCGVQDPNTLLNMSSLGVLEYIRTECGAPLNELVKHPVQGSRNTLSMTVISLNDSYNWSFERIIQWLRENNL